MESRTYKSRQARLRSVAEPTPPGTAVGPARQYQTQMNPSMQGHRRSRGSVASKELKKPSQTELEVNPLPPIRGKYQTSGPGASSELLNHTVNINIVNPITVIPNNPTKKNQRLVELFRQKRGVSSGAASAINNANVSALQSSTKVDHNVSKDERESSSSGDDNSTNVETAEVRGPSGTLERYTEGSALSRFAFCSPEPRRTRSDKQAAIAGGIVQPGPYQNPTEEMVRRWNQITRVCIPPIDLVDLQAEQRSSSLKRQFAPEFSQSSYLTMMGTEFAIGDYITNGATSGHKQGEFITQAQRRHMTILLESLHKEKKYKEETLYLSMSLCDRYLATLLSLGGGKAPCLIRLAITATLLGAKLEQPIQPSYTRMVRLVAQKWNIKVNKEDILNMEFDLIQKLDFDLHYTGPLPFMERYLRIFELDQEEASESNQAINRLCLAMCRWSMRSQTYLTMKPSWIAAAAITLAIHLSASDLAPQLGLTKVKLSPRFQSSFGGSKNNRCPLQMWNEPSTSLLTKLEISTNISNAYLALLAEGDKQHCKGMLATDANLRPKMVQTSTRTPTRSLNKRKIVVCQSP